MAKKQKGKTSKPKAIPAKSTSASAVNFELLKELSAFMRAEKLSSLKYEKSDFKCELKSASGDHVVAPRAQAPVANVVQAPQVESAPSASTNSKHELISSPFVGTFYRCSSPGADPFVEAGNIVNPGSTLCIIEAMKLMNEIEAEFKCRVVRVLVENGTPVEFGEPLFEVERIK